MPLRQFLLIYCQNNPTPARINVPPLHQRGANKIRRGLTPFILQHKIKYEIQKPGIVLGPYN